MRPVRLRYNEHRRDAINKTANTPFGDHFGKEHIQDQLHTNQNILDLKVLYRALDHPDRKIVESIHIRRRAPALNIQGSSWPIMRVLDHIVVRSADSTTSARVAPCAWSDHDLVIAEVPARRERRRPKVTIRSTRNLVPDALRLELLLADWAEVYRTGGVEDKWAAWRAAWSPALDKHMPLTKVRSRHQPSPWLADNEELRCMMRERDLARADRDADPCAETRQAYVTKRNAVKSAQCRARSSFFLSSYTHSRKQT